MKAEIINGWPQGNSIRILLTETSTAQVNSVRRALIADVPKLAITRLDFAQGINQDNATGDVYESVNTLPDEVIAPEPTVPANVTFAPAKVAAVVVPDLIIRLAEELVKLP